jgi:mersacidin/lichenicidin family type 2 lantibiotic
MKTFDIIRAWKDARYRDSLSAEEQTLIPAHPAGSIELDEEELDAVIGGLDDEDRTKKVGTAGCCSKYKPKPPAESDVDDDDGGGDESC